MTSRWVSASLRLKRAAIEGTTPDGIITMHTIMTKPNIRCSYSWKTVRNWGSKIRTLPQVSNRRPTPGLQERLIVTSSTDRKKPVVESG